MRQPPLSATRHGGAMGLFHHHGGIESEFITHFRIDHGVPEADLTWDLRDEHGRDVAVFRSEASGAHRWWGPSPSSTKAATATCGSATWISTGWTPPSSSTKRSVVVWRRPTQHGLPVPCFCALAIAAAGRWTRPSRSATEMPSSGSEGQPEWPEMRAAAGGGEIRQTRMAARLVATKRDGIARALRRTLS